MAFCHLESLIPFTDNNEIPVLHAYEGAMGIFLALQHLNTGNGSIIEQVQGLNETCRIRFPTEYFFDTRYNARRTFEYVDQRTSRRQPRMSPGFFQARPTAFLGGFSSSVTALAAYISSVRGIPQVSGQGTSSELDNKKDYPLFARTIPNEEYAARNVLLWWIMELKLTHVAVIHTSDMHGRAYARSLRNFVRQLQAMDGDGDEHNIIEVLYISLDEDGDNIPEVLETLKGSKFRYIFGVLQHQHLYDMLMEAAYQKGLAGNQTDEYNWFFSDTFRSVLVDAEERMFAKGSPLHLAYRGVGFIKPAAYGADTELGIRRNEKFDIFEESIRELRRSPEQIEFLRTVFPVDKETGQIPFVESFRTGLTYDTASFLYEATILMGLAVCQEANETLSILGEDFYDSILTTSFQGITGRVVLNQTTGSRLSNTTSYSILNFADVEVNNDGQELVRFRPVLTHYYSSENFGENISDGSGWSQVANFTFNHGTSNRPLSIPPPPDHAMYISDGIKAFALALYVVLLLMTLVCVGWTWYYRKDRVVRASQPFFLFLLCGGVVLVGSTIVSMVTDHRLVSIEGNSVACNATIWLAALGLGIVFSALLAKTYRINQIMKSAKKFRRIKVTVRETLGFVNAVVFANLIVLSLMTAFDPISYGIVYLSSDIFGRPTSSYGHCEYTSGSKGYLIALAVINIGTLLLALYQAWHARSLSTEFAESKYIAYALAGALIASFIGCPVLILAQENPDATAFVASSLVFLLCSMTLCMIFVPKMKFQRDLKKEADKDTLPHTKISGLTTEDVDVPPVDAVAEAFNDSEPLSIEENGRRRSSGEKILTSKSAPELLKEVNLLKYMAAMNRKTIEEQATEISELRSLLDRNGVLLPIDRSTMVPAVVDKAGNECNEHNKTDESSGS